LGKWAAFWVLGLIWGSSYLLIRISVEEMNQFEIVFIRTLIAAIGLNLVLLARGKRLPTDWKTLRPLILIGLGNTAIPFILITWGEKSVESGLASVLQATASLFSLVISHFAFEDERITPQKIGGLTIGFIGIVLLASRSWVNGQVMTSDLLGQLAIVLASLFYASFTVYSKKAIRNQIEPIMISAGAMTTAAIVSGILTFVSPMFGGSAPTPLSQLSPNVLFSVLTLGFFNTLLAYLIFYSLVQQIGSARTSMVTYVIPPVGLLLGVLFLNERMDARLLLGAALIFAGIAVVNVRLSRRARVMNAASEA
jgi:drug/metabolite transporter (DMT)-like permease